MTQSKGKDAYPETQAAESADSLFERLRRSGLPLNKQLEAVSARLEKSDPHYAKAYDQLVTRLTRSQAGDNAPRKGEQMLGFLLPDEGGHLLALDTLLENGPVVIAFLRGHWCPYCRLNAAALAGVEDAIAPAQIVAISAETGEFAKTLREESGAHFPFLTDVGNGYSLSLGLSFWLGEELEKMLYADACDIPTYHGAEGWFLPIPAVFVVGKNGLVKERYVNPDFRQRMEIDALCIAAMAASAADR
jgi:peroxiredoxin